MQFAAKVGNFTLNGKGRNRKQAHACFPGRRKGAKLQWASLQARTGTCFVPPWHSERVTERHEMGAGDTPSSVLGIRQVSEASTIFTLAKHVTGERHLELLTYFLCSHQPSLFKTNKKAKHVRIFNSKSVQLLFFSVPKIPE